MTQDENFHKINEIAKKHKFFFLAQAVIQRTLMVLIFIYIIHISRHQIGNFELFEISILCALFVWIIIVDQNHNLMFLEYAIRKVYLDEQEKTINKIETVFDNILENIKTRDENFKLNLPKKELEKRLLEIVKKVDKDKEQLLLEVGMVKLLCHEKVYQAINDHSKAFDSVFIYFKFMDQNCEKNISYELWSEIQGKLLNFMKKELNIKKERTNLMERKLKNIFSYITNFKWD